MSEGRENLWLWFGLSRAGWLTLPRALMHEMPDEWQRKMAELLTEWSDAWDTSHLPSTRVSAVERGKFTKFPEFILNYRHPDRESIYELRATANKSRP